MTPDFAAVAAGFVHESAPMRVVFGAGSLAAVPDEVERLGARRALIVAGGPEAAYADAVAAALGQAVAGRFADVAMHVPVEVARAAADSARAADADLVISVGGGSSTGAAKAIALETGLPILAVPTTYAGSEMTPIWGMTADGVKTVGRDRRVQPVTVVYDPELTVSLPATLSAESGMNAMAHLIEGLYAPGASPITTLVAEEGVRGIGERLVEGCRDLGEAGRELDLGPGRGLCRESRRRTECASRDAEGQCRAKRGPAECAAQRLAGRIHRMGLLKNMRVIRTQSIPSGPSPWREFASLAMLRGPRFNCLNRD